LHLLFQPSPPLVGASGNSSDIVAADDHEIGSHADEDSNGETSLKIIFVTSAISACDIRYAPIVTEVVLR
jgi:hypothetical protein